MSLINVEELYQRQDHAVTRNREATSREFGLIERGLVLGWAFTDYLHTPDILAQRSDLPEQLSVPENVCANLLHSAWCILVSASRLTLWGAHVDALTLVRSSFELAYHAEFFRHKPELAAEWDAAGQITDFEERRAYIDKFSRKIRPWLEEQDDPDRTRTRLYRDLSTYGTHANPATVGLRMSSGEPGVANLGFMSVGKSEATRLCAIHDLHVLMYVLSEFVDRFTSYLSQSSDLIASYESLRRDWEDSRKRQPLNLSLQR